MTLAEDIAMLVLQVRNRGGTMVDCHAIEDALARHGARLACDCRRVDLAADGLLPADDILAGDQLSRVLAP
jgi:hypothetical protein